MCEIKEKRSVLEIESEDNTSVIIFVDKIQYIIEKKDGCVIGLENGNRITSGAKFEDVKRALKDLI